MAETAVTSPAPSRVRVREIAAGDQVAVARLLARGFERPDWYYLRALERLARHPTPAGFPKFGVLMEAEGEVVGAVLLIYSALDGQIRCNVTSWYVEPAFKGFAALFTSRALRHRDVTYLNISARPAARPVIAAQGFLRYSAGQFVTLPLLAPHNTDAGLQVVAAGDANDSRFDPGDLELLAAHARYGCIGLWCVTPERAHPFVFLPRRFKRLLPGAQLIYCRDVADMVRFARPLGWQLARRGCLLVTIDALGPIPGLVGRFMSDMKPRFFKGPMAPRLGDIAYTQAAMFAWPWAGGSSDGVEEKWMSAFGPRPATTKGS